MNTSAWNSLNGRSRNPALSPGHVIVEFDRTKKSRIFAHKLGSVDFSARRDVNGARQSVIDTEIGNVGINGFKYKNIGHVHSESVVSTSTGTSSTYPVYSHGLPLGGTERAGMESCSRHGLKCRAGAGTDSLCQPGKCIIGTIERVNEGKWKYVSKNTYGTPALPVVYYLPAQESVVLKTILRGHYTTYSANGTPLKISVNKPASAFTRIYLPPSFYYSEDFIDTAIVTTDRRLESVTNKPTTTTVGLSDRKAKFVRSIIIASYPGTSEGYLNDRLHVTATEEIRDALLESFSGLDAKWAERCNEIVNNEFSYRYSKIYDGLDLISVVYDRVKGLFNSILQVTQSSLLAPSVSFGKESISRPVYSRLPGLAEGYRSDPSFSDVETPTQWLVSGTDEFLSRKKDSIASFYANYLDPDTCNPALLDWLAQHVGLFGSLWNELWDDKVKRAFIKNSFGWWDRESSANIPALGEVLTAKGEALEKFPFTQQEWAVNTETTAWGETLLSWNAFSTWSGNRDNLHNIKLDEIGTIYLENNVVVPNRIFKVKTYSETSGKVSLFYTDTARVDKSIWNGLMEAKGSLLGIAFLSSLFGLKAHSSAELQVVDAERKIFKPKTGLRNAEVLAPILLPYKQDIIQVGSEEEASTNNYTNQLVAGVSIVSSVAQSNNVFFRVPYYYNRDGKSWDRVSYITENWMPSNLNTRIQYAYLSADLWAVGDAFFEPEVIKTTVIVPPPVPPVPPEPPVPPTPPTPGNGIFDLVPVGYQMIESDTADNEFFISEQGDILLL